MPHLNELHNKYFARGLTILALTNDNVDAFVKEHSIVYPVGVGGPNGQAYGVQGIPQVYLVGASGKVVWEGHTSGVTEAMIEQELAKALVLPDRDWPKPVDKPAGLVKQKKLGKAWKDLERLTDLEGDAKTAADDLRKFIDDSAKAIGATIDELAASGDLFAAYEECTKAEDAFDGHPAGEGFQDKRKGWEKDKDAKKAIKAGALFSEAQRLEQKRDFKKAIPLYVQAAKIGDGTKIGEAAKARAEALSKNY